MLRGFGFPTVLFAPPQPHSSPCYDATTLQVPEHTTTTTAKETEKCGSALQSSRSTSTSTTFLLHDRSEGPRAHDAATTTTAGAAAAAAAKEWEHDTLKQPLTQHLFTSLHPATTFPTMDTTSTAFHYSSCAEPQPPTHLTLLLHDHSKVRGHTRQLQPRQWMQKNVDATLSRNHDLNNPSTETKTVARVFVSGGCRTRGSKETRGSLSFMTRDKEKYPTSFSHEAGI